MRVIEIFDSLQGEGYWTGVPMTFVRLAGCNAPGLGLECVRWCDTPASWDEEAGEDMQVGEILDLVRLPRLCITGGEPLVQPEGVAALVAEAHARGIRVHLETNGTADPFVPGEAAGEGPEEVLEFDWVVVSPKAPGYLISPGWDDRIDELKLVVDDQLDVAIAERLAADCPGAFVSIQPEFEARRDGSGGQLKNGASPAERGWCLAGSASVARAIALVLTHPDWRLSLQTHKLLGIH